MSAGEAAATALPERLPIFPLSGVLLLPTGKLPLNIFEPRYLEMVRDAMAGDRLIGMVQPITHESLTQCPEVYPIGGAGRITSFKETDDGRFLITLTGTARFVIERELEVGTSYRQVRPDWNRFAGDGAGDDDSLVDRERLLPALKAYLHLQKIPADWASIEKAPSGPLVNYLSMICPFEPSEKQALLEAHDLLERSRVVTALVEMAILSQTGGHPGDDEDDPLPGVVH